MAVAQAAEDIAGMAVAMEVAVEDDLFDHDAQEVVAQRAQIPACAGNCLGLDDLDAFHIFHGEHFGRGEVAVHLRHLHFGENRHVIGQAAGVEGLGAIVQFLDQVFGKFLEDAEDVVVVHPGEAVAERCEQLAQNFQVGLDLGHDVGALDFDHDRLASRERGLVDLGG